MASGLNLKNQFIYDAVGWILFLEAGNWDTNLNELKAQFEAIPHLSNRGCGVQWSAGLAADAQLWHVRRQTSRL